MNKLMGIVLIGAGFVISQASFSVENIFFSLFTAIVGCLIGGYGGYIFAEE